LRRSDRISQPQNAPDGDTASPARDRRDYANPPVISATCTLSIETPDVSDDFEFESFYRAISDQYDAMPFAQTAPSLPPSRATDWSKATVTFRNHTNTRTLNAAIDELSLRSDVQYAGWPTFRSQIDEVVSAWLTEHPSTRLAGANLTYENVITVPRNFGIDEFVPLATEPGDIGSFTPARNYRSEEFRRESDGSRLRITVFRYPARSAQGPRFVSLDIEAAVDDLADVLLVAYADIVEILHDSVSDAFEHSISERARNSFGPSK
jgi:uncharacterized protein (TIGR04255 family)